MARNNPTPKPDKNNPGDLPPKRRTQPPKADPAKQATPVKRTPPKSTPKKGS